MKQLQTKQSKHDTIADKTIQHETIANKQSKHDTIADKTIQI